ncbi:MAG: dipeptidase [Clostridiaceae bacterium]|nr:dipeptidase [Clostridiaceae bacterium]
MKVFDMHCDTLMAINDGKKSGGAVSFGENNLHIDLNKLKKGDYLLQCMAAFVHLERDKNPLETAMEEFDVFYQIMDRYSDSIAQVKCFEDLERNRKDKKISAMLTVEEGGTCLGNPAVLRMFYQLGVRMMTLTWNFENELAYPNRMPHSKDDNFPAAADLQHGLKERGIEFVKEMERLHMVVDVSHLSDAGFWDVAKYSTRPFIASHSNARAMCGHVRNLTDDMLKTMGERGCLLGINYCAAFLDPQENEANCRSTVALMADHIRYIQNLAGIDIIGLGSDFDGIGSELEMKDASCLPMLETELRKRGFHESEIEKIFYKNAVRVFKELL